MSAERDSAPRRVAGRLRAAVRNRLYPATDAPAEHLVRRRLNESADAYLGSLDRPSMRAAEIAGEAHAARGWREYDSLGLPEFDLCAPLEREGGYDVVICEQVLEHVPDPLAAAGNLRALCAEGGHVVVSTPFLVRVHELPAYGMGDYWRFTPRGLRTLLERAGLEVERVEAWGNRGAVLGNLDHWARYRPWHSLRNEPDLPVQVWAFARNRG